MCFWHQVGTRYGKKFMDNIPGSKTIQGTFILVLWHWFNRDKLLLTHFNNLFVVRFHFFIEFVSKSHKFNFTFWNKTAPQPGKAAGGGDRGDETGNWSGSDKDLEEGTNFQRKI